MSAEPVALPRVIRTERLTLRPWALSDVDDVMAYAQDPTWARHLPVPQPYEWRQAVEWVARAHVTDWEQHPLWAIEFNGRVVGGAELSLEWDHRRGERGDMSHPEGPLNGGRGRVVSSILIRTRSRGPPPWPW